MSEDRSALIAEALGHAPSTARNIDVGYDFEVAIVDEEWVFRFPRRREVETALEREIALLPVLLRVLPVEVPRFEHVSEQPLFVGYRLIRGAPLVDEDGDGVHAFLEALHAVDVSELSLERRDWREAYREQCAEFERLVLPLVDDHLQARAVELFGEVDMLVGFEPTLLHADLGPSTCSSARADSSE